MCTPPWGQLSVAHIMTFKHAVYQFKARQTHGVDVWPFDVQWVKLIITILKHKIHFMTWMWKLDKSDGERERAESSTNHNNRATQERSKATSDHQDMRQLHA